MMHMPDDVLAAAGHMQYYICGDREHVQRTAARTSADDESSAATVGRRCAPCARAQNQEQDPRNTEDSPTTERQSDLMAHMSRMR
jgi:hypothetical protein